MCTSCCRLVVLYLLPSQSFLIDALIKLYVPVVSLLFLSRLSCQHQALVGILVALEVDFSAIFIAQLALTIVVDTSHAICSVEMCICA